MTGRPPAAPGAGRPRSAVAAGDGPAPAEPPGDGPAAGSGRTRARGPRADRWKTALVLLAAAGIAAGVAWALLGSRFFVVRSVSVTGLHRVTRSQVLAAARIPQGLPLVRVDTATVSRRVEAITQVRSARVSRNWPDGVVIHVMERAAALAVADNGRYDLIDGAGIVVTSTARRPAGIPLFWPSGPIRASRAVSAAVAVVHRLPAWLSRRLTSVAAATAYDVTLHFRGGVTVVWGSPGRSAAKERVLSALMQTHAHFYDVSSPSVATTR